MKSFPSQSRGKVAADAEIANSFYNTHVIDDLLQGLQPEDSSENEILTIQEAAKCLKATVSALYTKVSRREIPVSKLCKRLYVNKYDLKKWIINSRRKTVLEIRKAYENT